MVNGVNKEQIRGGVTPEKAVSPLTATKMRFKDGEQSWLKIADFNIDDLPANSAVAVKVDIVIDDTLPTNCSSVLSSMKSKFASFKTTSAGVMKMVQTSEEREDYWKEFPTKTKNFQYQLNIRNDSVYTSSNLLQTKTNATNYNFGKKTYFEIQEISDGKIYLGSQQDTQESPFYTILLDTLKVTVNINTDITLPRSEWTYGNIEFIE